VTQHIDELAELYALGVLDEEERARVDAHAIGCDTCAGRLGEAERTVAFMEQSAPVPASLDRRMSGVFFRKPRFQVPSALVAAAFVVGLLPSLWFWNTGRNAQAYDADRQQAVHAMVSSHFSHAQFIGLTAGAPKAKLLYARTGAWLFAVAETGRALSLRAETANGIVPLGTLHASGQVSELYVPQAPHASVFGLWDGNREVGRVTIPRR
jgi:Putative zinc-finger